MVRLSWRILSEQLGGLIPSPGPHQSWGMPDRKLYRVITLRDGRKLRTVGDAVPVLEEITARNLEAAYVNEAINLLTKATETGKGMKAATAQLETVLRGWRMLDP